MFIHSYVVSLNSQGTQKQQKNELLFQKFHINYKNLPAMYRQGSCIFKIEVILYSAKWDLAQMSSPSSITMVWRVNFVGSIGCTCDLPLKKKKKSILLI